MKSWSQDLGVQRLPVCRLLRVVADLVEVDGRRVDLVLFGLARERDAG